MVMIHYLNALSYWHWLIFAVILIILEFLLRGGGFLLWLALIAGVVGLLVGLFPLLAWPYQLLIFSLGGIICLVSWWTHLLSHTKKK